MKSNFNLLKSEMFYEEVKHMSDYASIFWKPVNYIFFTQMSFIHSKLLTKNHRYNKNKNKNKIAIWKHFVNKYWYNNDIMQWQSSVWPWTPMRLY